MSQALYRKWRPRLWEQVIGQEPVVRTLQNAIRTERVGHGYLFAGPRGTGKTTTARLLARAVNCLHPDPGQRPCDQCDHCRAVNEGRFLDLIEIDAASNTSVEDVRDLRDKINFAPSQGKFKVYIIDEVHMLSTAAFNALLKTLEEPPAHAIFILATTEVHKIPATVISRVQRHEFRRIPVPEIVGHLQNLARQEGIEVELDALQVIARQSTGAMRDAISLLDQLASTGERVTLETAQTVLGTATNQIVLDLVNAVINRNPAQGLECIHQALDNGTDPRQFARHLVEYLLSLLLIRLGNSDQIDATRDMREQMARHAAALETDRLLNVIRLFNQASSDARSAWHPGLLLELALAESCDILPTAPIQTGLPESAPVKAQTAKPKTEKTTVVDENIEDPAANIGPAYAARGIQPDPSVTLAEINKSWRKIRDVVRKQSPSTEALLNSSKPLSVNEGILLLGLVGEVLVNKMKSKENLDMTCRAIAQVVGKPVGIACTMLTSRNTTAPLDLDVDSDGLVSTALNLGGQIVDKK